MTDIYYRIHFNNLIKKSKTPHFLLLFLIHYLNCLMIKKLTKLFLMIFQMNVNCYNYWLFNQMLTKFRKKNCLLQRNVTILHLRKTSKIEEWSAKKFFCLMNDTFSLIKISGNDAQKS